MTHKHFPRRMRRLQLVLVAGGVALGALFTPPAALAADGKKALVARIVQLQQGDVENLSRALVNQAMQPRLQAIGQALGKLPQDKRDALAKEIQTDVRKAGTEMESLVREKALKLAPAVLGAGLDEKFSEEELRQIVSWLESSTARKFQQYATEAQGALVQKVVAEAKAQIDPKLQSLDQKIKARFTAIANTGSTQPPAAAASK